MQEYQAPLADMQFVLRELVDHALLARLPGFEDATLELGEAVLEEAAKFAGGVLSPLNRVGDREGVRWSDTQVATAAGWKQAYGQFVEGGWSALACPREFGGQNLPRTLSALVEEMWNGANMAFTLCPMLTRGAIEAIDLKGSQHLKETYLPKMVSGEWTGTMNLTEPQAGSDLAAVRTLAEPLGGGRYTLKGQKIFITYGEHDLTENIIHMVLARTPGAPDGVKGMSLFVVPKFLVNADGSPGERNDVRCLSVEHKLGIHASPTCVLAFGQQGGAVGELIGEENRGLEYMFIMMNAARFAVGLEGIGLSERAFQAALAFANERIQGTEPGHEGTRADRAASGHPSHADAHQIEDRSDACSRERLGGVARYGARASGRTRARPASGVRRFDDSRHQGVVHREFRGAHLAGDPGSRRHGLHRGNGRRAAVSGCAHHADL